MPPRAEPRSLLDDSAFLDELEKLETGTPRPQPVSRRAVRADPTRTAAPALVDAQPAHAEPALGSADAIHASRAERAADMARDAFVSPEPLAQDTTSGRGRAYYDDGEHIGGRVDAANLPRGLAALVVLLGIAAGAGSAAFLLQDRVERIVTSWTLAAR